MIFSLLMGRIFPVKAVRLVGAEKLLRTGNYKGFKLSLASTMYNYTEEMAITGNYGMVEKV